MKYLVQIQSELGLSACLMTANEIIQRQDATDYTDEELFIFDISEKGVVKPLQLLGCWHNPSDPLYIKAVDNDGNTVFDSYGTDH